MSRPTGWLRVTVHAASSLDADLIAQALIDAGGAAVRQDAASLTTHLPLADGAEAALGRVRAALTRAGVHRPDGVLDWAIEADRDWAVDWKAGLRARRIGERLVVHPTWQEPDDAGARIRIAIDPGLAFGTAEHASTRGALRLLESVVRPGWRVLDAGTGSGILAIAASALGAGSVLAVDSDREAVATARANLDANGVGDAVTTMVAEVTPRWLAGRPEAPFDLIAANILSGVLVPLLDPLRNALRPGGALILAGILLEESAEFGRAAAAHRLRLVREDEEDGWWSGLFRAAPAAR